MWEDTDADGFQDDFEFGVPGVTVHLLNEAGLIIDTMATDSNGFYLFSGLRAGTYEVQFVVPDGFEVSSLRAAPAAVDSDAGAAGRTGAISLASGEVDLTWDAGIYQTPQVLPQVITTTTTVAQTSESLPFTGMVGSGLGGIGAALVAFGGLVVLALRRREEEAVATIPGSWIPWSGYRGKHRERRSSNDDADDD